jgi:hydroxymethylpyrimidine/phosphomethylpyrimidine kinase
MSPPGSDQPIVLTIAGLDPSGGAGIVADLRTFHEFHCRVAVALTALTFQNDSELLGAEHFSAATLSAQVLSIIRQHPVSAAKTGMLPTRELVVEAARLFRETSLPAPVIDPVMRASSGYALVQDDAIAALVEELLPLARIITPNLPEAELLTGLRIVDEAGMRRAAAALRARGAGAVLIKGGHLEAEQTGGEESTTREAIDVLDDGGSVTTFRAAWIDAPNIRGTGCMLSAAIAACLARGDSLEHSVGKAKRFVHQSIARS